MKEIQTLSPEKKENEDMFFIVSVRTASGNLFTEMITAENKDHAIEKMGNAFSSLTKSELKKAVVGSITKEEYKRYDEGQKRNFAIINKTR